MATGIAAGIAASTAASTAASAYAPRHPPPASATYAVVRHGCALNRPRVIYSTSSLDQALRYVAGLRLFSARGPGVECCDAKKYPPLVTVLDQYAAEGERCGCTYQAVHLHEIPPGATIEAILSDCAK